MSVVTNAVRLSILYLRCPNRPSLDVLLHNLITFNSLFQMAKMPKGPKDSLSIASFISLFEMAAQQPASAARPSGVRFQFSI